MATRSATPAPDLLSVGAMARALGISPSYVRKLEAKGLVPLRQQDGTRLYLPNAVEKARPLIKRLNRRRRRRKAAADV
jgi:DNA-binding transcriptional MerR regulator